MLSLHQDLFSIQKYKNAAIVLIFLVSSFGIAFIVLFMTHCHFFDQPWNPLPGGWCRDFCRTRVCRLQLQPCARLLRRHLTHSCYLETTDNDEEEVVCLLYVQSGPRVSASQVLTSDMSPVITSN